MVRLYNNPELREYLVKNEVKIVKDRFNVERTAREHRDLFMKLTGREEESGEKD